MAENTTIENAAASSLIKTNNDDDNNNNDDEKTETSSMNIRRWKKWVPMDSDLYATLQQAQLCMLQKVDELFHAADIPYWICGGALIGAIRHQGFIPHDDDIDLECFQEDLPRISELFPLDPPLFTRFVEHSSVWEGHPVATLQFFQGLLEVDVFPRPSPPLPTGERYFPSQEEVFPRTRYKFHNIQVWGPNRNNCTTYLDRCYGKDWRDTVCVYNHDYNWWHSAGFDPRKEVVSLEEYNQIVEGAGIQSSQAAQEGGAKATFRQLFGSDQDLDAFIENYKSYKFQRTFRRNRAAAEYRESQREEESNA